MTSSDWLPPRPYDPDVADADARNPAAAGARPAPARSGDSSGGTVLAVAGGPPEVTAGPVAPEKPAWRRYGAIFIAVALLVAKFGKVALVALKGTKVITTSVSMLVSVAAYGLIWGWPFAAGFVALLFIHELGHVIQLRREGVRPTGMLFIPFLGAAVGARSLGGSALAEARVGLAGPILGSLGALAVMVAGFATGSDFLRALAFTAFFLNLINLLPVVPLDGGRAMAAMAPWMWFVGLGVMVTYLFIYPSPVLILFALLGALSVYSRWKSRHEEFDGNPDYYAVTPRQRLAVGAVYICLIGALALAMDVSYVPHDFGDA